MKKKKQQKNTNANEEVTLKDFLDENLVKKLKEEKKKLEMEEKKKKELEEQRKREEKRWKEKNKSFEELLAESDLDWRQFK